MGDVSATSSNVRNTIVANFGGYFALVSSLLTAIVR
jgi:hypothetical protein